MVDRDKLGYGGSLSRDFLFDELLFIATISPIKHVTSDPPHLGAPLGLLASGQPTHPNLSTQSPSAQIAKVHDSVWSSVADGVSLQLYLTPV